MKPHSAISGNEDAKEAGSGEREVLICPACGTKFIAATNNASCPVCLLRSAAIGKSVATEAPDPASTSEYSFEERGPTSFVRRFENYEVLLGEGGQPIELGRGAMGITYKAFDVDLRIPVTLKVISERYLGDESAQLRFLREARAAGASVTQMSPRFST